MKRTYGFTTIELIAAIVLFMIVASLIMLQKNNVDASSRDQQRKTSVNAIYFGLKQGFFPQNQYYPVEVTKKDLPYINPVSFDQVGEKKYKVQYKGLNCENLKCQGFELRVRLEKETVYKRGG